jgi:hypothetical protein
VACSGQREVVAGLAASPRRDVRLRSIACGIVIDPGQAAVLVAPRASRCSPWLPAARRSSLSAASPP